MYVKQISLKRVFFYYTKYIMYFYQKGNLFNYTCDVEEYEKIL